MINKKDIKESDVLELQKLVSLLTNIVEKLLYKEGIEIVKFQFEKQLDFLVAINNLYLGYVGISQLNNLLFNCEKLDVKYQVFEKNDFFKNIDDDQYFEIIANNFVVSPKEISLIDSKYNSGNVDFNLDDVTITYHSNEDDNDIMKVKVLYEELFDFFKLRLMYIKDMYEKWFNVKDRGI